MKIAKVPHREENGRTILLIKEKKPWEISKGHAPHRSGAGIHADKRTKRAKTRQAVRQRVLAESY